MNPLQDDLHQDRQRRHRRIEALRGKLASPPRILSRTAGRDTCTIFRVPLSFIDVNGKYYIPRIVSIGPFHHGREQLEMIQEHKYHYLSVLLSRTELTLEELFQTLDPVENQARESYSEQIGFDCHEFVELLVVDGCFIIELFRKVARLVEFEYDDPILSMSWIFPFLIRDLVRLENQIPFFVLQRLFDRTRGKSNAENSENASLVDICFEFFGYFVERPPQVVADLRRFQAKHLLDLYRTSFIPPDLDTKKSKGLAESGRNGDISSHMIPCISKLRRAGIKLRPPRNDDSESFLAVRFRRHGLIEMPTVTLDDFMSTFFANSVAFELSHYKTSKYFTAYTTMLDCLINTAKDVEYLSDHNLIENYFGTEADVADFINNLGKDALFDPDNSYLSELFKEVNHYCKNHWNVHWATFKFTYFNTPWTFISVVAAFILLVLSILQALYAVLAYQQQNTQTQHTP